MKKITWNAPVVLTFTLISAIALLLNIITNGYTNRMFFSVYRTSLLDPLQYLRLFTHVLGHASWSHFAGNMMLFLLVGPILEEKYGSMRLLELILIVAFVTGVLHIIIAPGSALLGASGVVFSFILLASVTGTGKGIPLTLILTAGIYIAQNISTSITASNISEVTHIVGGTLGALYGLTVRK